MDINRKKVLFIASGCILSEEGGFTDFHIRKDVLDRIQDLNISHVAIIFPNSEHHVKVKTLEFFVFAYCKVAVSTHTISDTLMDEVTEMLQHNMRNRDLMLSVGIEIDNIDNISLEDFLQ